MRTVIRSLLFAALFAPLAVLAACPPTICLIAVPAGAGSTAIIDGYAAGGGTVNSNYGIAIGLQAQAGKPGEINPINGLPCAGTSTTGAFTNCGQTAVGMMASAKGLSASAYGAGAKATGDQSSALGESSTASGANSTAVGNGATATGNDATATGMSALALNNGATADGALATATGSNATAVGFEAQSTGANSTAVGAWAAATGTNSVSVGGNAAGADSTALGSAAQATGANSTATGQGARATAPAATALGSGSVASATGSVALGEGSVATQADTVSVGDATTGYERRITNVAPGIAPTDAVNVWQLQSVVAGLQGQINGINTRIDSLAAAGQAQSQMAMACGRDRSCFSVGLGSDAGQGAVAIGYRRQIFSGRATWSAGLSNGGGMGTAAGVGFSIRLH